MLYCWELQVEAAAKRRGLGRFLMQLLELLACRYVLRMQLQGQSC